MTEALTLRPYQRDALDAIWREYGKGNNRILIQKATGLGKTVTFAEIPKYGELASWLAEFKPRDRRMLVIAHREELIMQAAEKIRRANPELMVGIEQGDLVAGPFDDVVIASIQTLQASDYRRTERLLKYGPFRITVVDEAHHAAAETYRNVLVRLGFLPPEELGSDPDVGMPDAARMATILREWETAGPKDRILLGFTATPNRNDAVGLGCVFQTIAYRYLIGAAIKDGWLAPITPYTFRTDTRLDDVKVRAGEFDQKQLAEAVNTPERNITTVLAWEKVARGRSTLAFTVDVQHAHDMAAAFRSRGVPAMPISGKTPKDERRRILAEFSKGRIPVLCNAMLLTEGTDLPITSCIVHAKPTKSASLYEQMTGRGLRLYEGKEDCVIVDMVDVTRKHSLQTVSVLVGLPPLDPKGKSLMALKDEWEALKEKYANVDLESLVLKFGNLAIEDIEKQLKADRVNIWAINPLEKHVASELGLNWIRVSDQAYRIQYPWGAGHEILRVEPDMIGHYAVSCTVRGPNGGVIRQTTIGAQISDVVSALRMAEQFITTQRRTVADLKDKNAWWRKKPASPAQTGILRKRGIPYKANITKGEASDLIDLANSRRTV